MLGEKARRKRYAGDAAAEDGRVLDPVDAEAVRRFQRRPRLRDDVRIGARTQTALRSIRAERSGRNGASHDHTGHDHDHESHNEEVQG